MSYSATPQVNMPAPAHPVPTPQTSTSEAQATQSPNNTTSSDHDTLGESVTATSGPTGESPAAATIAAPSNQPIPTPDTTAVPDETPAEPGEGNTSVRAKKKRKSFRPSTAKTAKCAPAISFSSLSCSPCSGVCRSASGLIITLTEPGLSSLSILKRYRIASSKYVRTQQPTEILLTSHHRNLNRSQRP